jgi:hypothetical protein
MDAETIKRLKAWFYLRLATEDWTQFGANAEQVLQTFDHDPDQEDALLRFAEVVILLEIQKQKTPRQAFALAKKRHLELKQLGLTKAQASKVAGTDRLVAEGYLEPVCDAQGEPVYRDGEPVYRMSEKGRQLQAQGPPPPQGGKLCT